MRPAHPSTFRLVLAVLAVFPGAATAATLAITQPQSQQVLTWMPLDLAVVFDAAADDATLAVTLNGSDVTPWFALDPPAGGVRTARASDVWGAFVLVGRNTLAASIEVAGVPQQDSVVFQLSGDPYADEVVSLSVGQQGGFNSTNPGVVLGAPQGAGLFQGSLDVVSLGFSEAGGVTADIVVAFRDNRIVDGPGDDFTVFENSFLETGAGNITEPPFAEPGLVSVSQDGETWHTFGACPIDDDQAGPYWPGCAGIYPVLSNGTSATPHASIPTTTPIADLVGVSVFSLIPPTGSPPAGSGGDSFDLADVGLPWVRYVKVVSATYATGPVGANNGGFDLDAVAAIHSAAEVSPVPALGTPGRLFAAALLAASVRWVRRRGTVR